MEQKIFSLVEAVGMVCLALMMIPVFWMGVRAWAVHMEAKIIKRKIKQQ